MVNFNGEKTISKDALVTLLAALQLLPCEKSRTYEWLEGENGWINIWRQYIQKFKEEKDSFETPDQYSQAIIEMAHAIAEERGIALSSVYIPSVSVFMGDSKKKSKSSKKSKPKAKFSSQKKANSSGSSKHATDQDNSLPEGSTWGTPKSMMNPRTKAWTPSDESSSGADATAIMAKAKAAQKEHGQSTSPESVPAQDESINDKYAKTKELVAAWKMMDEFVGDQAQKATINLGVLERLAALYADVA